MKIEEKVFEQKKFIPEKLLKYGFCEVGNGYEYKTDFMNGEFQASIFVTKEGKASGKVIDVMNDEKYSRLHAENCSDSYVISVQNAYIELLTSIAESCCKILLFASAQANRIMEKISQKYKVEPDFPWAKQGGFKNYKNYGVFRHKGTKKWFAIIMDVNWHSLLKNKNFATVDIINLKVEFVEYFKNKGIYPAYHMDKENWVSITLDETLEDDVITNIIDLSFNVTNEK